MKVRGQGKLVGWYCKECFLQQDHWLKRSLAVFNTRPFRAWLRCTGSTSWTTFIQVAKCLCYEKCKKVNVDILDPQENCFTVKFRCTNRNKNREKSHKHQACKAMKEMCRKGQHWPIKMSFVSQSQEVHCLILLIFACYNSCAGNLDSWWGTKDIAVLEQPLGWAQWCDGLSTVWECQQAPWCPLRSTPTPVSSSSHHTTTGLVARGGKSSTSLPQPLP